MTFIIYGDMGDANAQSLPYMKERVKSGGVDGVRREFEDGILFRVSLISDLLLYFNCSIASKFKLPRRKMRLHHSGGQRRRRQFNGRS
jgi:hypothetical protein